MKILFDHQTFDLQNFGGISRYYYELMANFDTDPAISWELPIKYSNNLYLRNLALVNRAVLPKIEQSELLKNFFWKRDFRGKVRLHNLKLKFFSDPSTTHSEQNKLCSIMKLKEGNFDVFHPTYYDDYFLNFIGAKPYVLTVYDLIHQVFPEFYLYDAKDKNRNLIDKASMVIAISENTKADLVNIFGVDENKVKVTHLASSLNPDNDQVTETFKQRIPANYLLYNGVRDGYKNFMFFSQVVAALARNEKDLCVVCTGPPFTKSEYYLFDKLGISSRMHHAYITDVELTYLYKNATAFVFPSMYEGFGLPVLEAFSCGCPVLASSTSSLLEIGGDAAIYFEPKNALSIIRAIKNIINDEELRRNQVEKGYQQLKKFSWANTAMQTKAIYSQVLTGSLLRTTSN